MFSSRVPSFANSANSRRSSWSSSSYSSETFERSIHTTTWQDQPFQLNPTDLEDQHRNNLYDRSPQQRQPFRIPRPTVTFPQASIPSIVSQSSSIDHEPSPSSPTRRSEQQQVYVVPIQSRSRPSSTRPSRRTIPKKLIQRIKKNKYIRERTPGFCTTLLSGGFSTAAALLYLLIILIFPTTKLVLGIVYFNQCPINQYIPLYMIVAGSAGLALIFFLLLSSSCSYKRSSIVARKQTHSLMICVIGLSRGIKGVLGLFLIVWFFFGNVWVFSVRYRVRTDPADNNGSNSSNYCHPGLYWFAFYVLIATYFIALFICFLKFCSQLFCCGACELWKKAFS